MIELIKQSAVPSNMMRSAAKGALAVSPAETIEILVYLTSSPVFGEEARMTLAGWDEAACRQVCSDPATPKEVLNYFLHNRRPPLMPALLENPVIAETELLQMAQEQSTESVQWLLASPRAMRSRAVLNALGANPVMLPSQLLLVRDALEKIPAQQIDQLEKVPAQEIAAPPEMQPCQDEGGDDAIAQYMAEHAQEIAAEEGRSFELVGEAEDETQPAEAAAAAAAPASPAPASPEPQAAPAQNAQPAQPERVSPLLKISRMTVGERVQLAMKGSKEERYILIRDGSKVVSSAVLESPKVTDQEVETFASMKNVQESVLRGIASKRKFMKVYAVIRALVNNPRCPLDVQLTLMKNLLNMDLKAVSMNKNIGDTVRKLALKMFQERAEKKSG